MDDKELDKLFGITPEDSETGEGKDTEPAGSPESANNTEHTEEKKPAPEEEKDGTGVEVSSEEETEEETEDEKQEAAQEPEEPEASHDDEKPRGKTPESKPIKRKISENKPVPVNGPAREGSFRDMIPFTNAQLAAIILGVAFITMVLCIIFLPAFRVKTVNIEGNVVLTDEEILAMTGLEYNAHLMSGVSGNIFDILSLNYGKTEQMIMERNPYVESITISVKIPSTVTIEVKERQKIAYIKTADGYLAIDRDGIVLELSSADNASDVRPVICGMEIDGAKLGEKLTIKNINAFKKAIIVLGAILNADNASVGGDYNMFENTSEVRILPSGYLFLTIYSPSGNMVQIKLNNLDSINDDMAWLLYAFNANAFDQVTSSGALDMTGDEYIYQEYK